MTSGTAATRRATSLTVSFLRKRALGRTMASTIAATAVVLASSATTASTAGNDDRDAARIAKMGVDSRFHSEVDTLPGTDGAEPGLAWQFPRREAATLEVGQSLTFTLPSGQEITLPLVDRVWVAQSSLGLSFSDPSIGASAEIVLHKGLVSGGLRFASALGVESWAISTELHAGGVAVDRIAPAADQPSLGGSYPLPEELAQSGDGGGDGGVAGDGCDDSGATIDVLFTYTPTFAAGFASTDVLEALILADLQRMNLALVVSEAAPRLRAVDIIPAEDDGTGSLFADLAQLALTSDGWSDSVHVARNATRADLVVLYTDSAPGVASFISVVNGVGSQFSGFSAVGSIGGLDLARVLAINMGCCDAPGDSAPATCQGAYSFSNAYRFTVGSTTYRTLLAAEPGTLIPYFSNPRVEYLATPTGTNAANNARSLSLASATVASYRCSTGPSPDCDADGILDSIAIESGLVPDCNRTGIPDSCDIALGISLDANNNGVPDECPLVDSQFVPPGLAVLDTVGSAVSASVKSADPVVIYGFGAPGSDVGRPNAGAAWLLSVTAGVPNPALARVIRPADPVENAFFGRGISVFKRPANASPAYPARNMVCVGAYRWREEASVGNFPSKGAIYLFDEQLDGSWAQVRHGIALTPWRYTPPTTGGNAAGPFSLFGYSVALGRNPIEQSETIIVGAPGRNDGAGAVYVVRNPATNIPALHTMRTLTSPVSGDGFGTSVALAQRIQTSGNARVAFVAGAPGRSSNRGAAYIFERPAAPSSFGTWAPPFTLIPGGAGLEPGDRFGTAVAISEKLIVVGAPGDDGGKGRVYFWERSNGTGVSTSWSFRGSYAPPDGVSGDAFGSSVAVAPTSTAGVFTVTVGAPGRDVLVGTTPRLNAGAAYLLTKTTGASGAVLLGTRAAFAPASGDEFGYSAAAVPGFTILGAPFNDAAGLNAGLIRVNTNP